MVGVRGRAEDRVNHGRLGPKGLYGWQGQLHDRLTRPMIRNGTTLVEASWDEAMDLITTRSRELLDSKGPLSHGFYTSGQLMLGGVLHVGRHRQGWDRHASYGRQHPAVHCDGRRIVE